MRQSIPTILVSIGLLSCSESGPKKLDIQKMTIDLEIVPEDYNGGYTISWNDTLGYGQGFDLQNRPNELYCFITNNTKDTL